jgi:type 1 glutamine amidotransferase
MFLERTGRSLLCLSLLATALFSQLPPGATQPQTVGGGRGASGGRGPADPWPGKKKLLAIGDVHTGYHHDSTTHALSVIERLGRESGAYVTVIHTDMQVVTKGPIYGLGRYAPPPGGGPTRNNAKNLDFYDAIFFIGEGDGDLTDQQKTDLLSFIKDDGKGFVGAHASNGDFTPWTEFGEMLGGNLDGEFPTGDMPVIVEDPKFPGMDAFPLSFVFRDQFPIVKEPYSRDKVHVLARLDASKLDLTKGNGMRRADKDFPIAWAKTYGKGRVYFNSLGHPEETWDDPRVQKMYLEGIKWVMGMTNPDVTPRPMPNRGQAK